MQTQEQQLILDLSQRLQQDGAIQKDRDADILIAEKIANQPDALYKLVQAVLLQQLALQQAQQDLTALKSRVQQLEQNQNSLQKPSSFLGGFADKIFGTSPTPNAAPTPPPTMAAGNPWQQQQPPQQGYNQNPYAGGAPAQAGGAGSSFLASAASSALGVAGGMALFHGMSNLFGGHSASPFGSSAATTTPTETTNVTNNYYSDPDSNASQSSNDYGQDDFDSFGGDDNF